MKTNIDQNYVKAYLINGMLGALPLREATTLMEELTPQVCQIIEERYRRYDDYYIKKAFAIVLRDLALTSKSEQTG